MVLCVAWLAHRPAHGQPLPPARSVQRQAQTIIERARRPQLIAGTLKVAIQMGTIEHSRSIASRPGVSNWGGGHPAMAG